MTIKEMARGEISLPNYIMCGHCFLIYFSY